MARRSRVMDRQARGRALRVAIALLTAASLSACANHGGTAAPPAAPANGAAPVSTAPPG